MTLVELIVRRKGYVVSKLTTEADITDHQQLRQLLVPAVATAGTSPRSTTTR